MSARTALVIARARAETRMVDTCVIVRAGAPSSDRDPVTGEMLPPVDTAVYSGPCALDELRAQNPTPTSVGGDLPVSMIATLKLPAMGPRVSLQDSVTITAAPDHPQDVGLRFKVTSFNPETQAKARLFQMQSVIG